MTQFDCIPSCQGQLKKTTTNKSEEANGMRIENRGSYKVDIHSRCF